MKSCFFLLCFFVFFVSAMQVKNKVYILNWVFKLLAKKFHYLLNTNHFIKSATWLLCIFCCTLCCTFCCNFCWNKCLYILQKQPSRVVLKKRCSENIQQIYRSTHMPKCDFNNAALQLYGNHTLVWVFSCKFAAFFLNNFF